MARIGQALKVATKTVARDLAGYRVRKPKIVRNASPLAAITATRGKTILAEADLPVSGPHG
jgi:hypothetical protein